MLTAGVAQSCALRAILEDKIAALVDLVPQRRTQLRTALQELVVDLTAAEQSLRTPVYLMEGATGVLKEAGRVSTDPDENMALKVICAVAHYTRQAAIVVVPDAANQDHTLTFVANLGATVAAFGLAPKLEAGTVYVVAENDAPAMLQAAEQTQSGRNVFVLGPPGGYAHLLLPGDTHVRIMGRCRLGGDGLDERCRSTNTREPKSSRFLMQALMGHCQQFSSAAMGPCAAVSLTELALGTKLITEADKAHWMKNSTEQFLGLAPSHLLGKRLLQSGAHVLFTPPYEAGSAADRSLLAFQEQKGARLAFASLFRHIGVLRPDAAALTACLACLGPGYESLAGSKAEAVAKQYLDDILTASQHQTSDRMRAECEASKQIVRTMTSAQAVHTFVALALAFKSIYDEKTTDAWRCGAVAGQQWRLAQFQHSFQAYPGRQVPYDALVVLQPYCGFGDTDDAKALCADKVQLMLWS